jgi:hypothetical protein
MDPYLHQLGLYQIVIMGDCQLEITPDSACREVVIRDADISSISRQDDGDVGGRVLSMRISYQKYFKFLIYYFIFYF